MWTKGLDPWRIAELCRVPYRKVYDHIRTRITYHPEVFGQRPMVHDQPGGMKKPKPTWEERAADLIDFRQVYGRFPRGYLEGKARCTASCKANADDTGPASSLNPGSAIWMTECRAG